MKKTDNGHLKQKLDLRRRFLRNLHKKINVFDACQGSGTLWKILRSEFAIENYWGVDIKVKFARIKVDSKRVFQTKPIADIYDIDTYGSPWGHYEILLGYLSRPAIVFLTMGNQNQVAMQPHATGSKILRLPSQTPQVLAGKVSRALSVNAWLTRPCANGNLPAEIVEVKSTSAIDARYFAVRFG
jgi:hypothetical protein